MEEEKIIVKLKEYKDSKDITIIDKLINDLYEDIKEKNYIKEPSDKQKYNAIKRILKESESNGRDILTTYSTFENGVMFTDSYRAFFLKDEYLPFKIAVVKDNNFNNEDRVNELVAKYNLKKILNSYPSLQRYYYCKDENEFYKVKINLNDWLKEYRTKEKDDDGLKIGKVEYKTGDNTIVVTYNMDYMKDVITILKLKDDFELELHGDNKPIRIQNSIGELAVVLPIKNY